MSWIKMRTNLTQNPKVVMMSLTLKLPPYAVCGAVFAVWALADAQTEDGTLHMTAEALDAVTGCPGIADAMTAVGWLSKEDANLVIPAFDTHNSQSAKARAAEAVRSASRRATGNRRSDSGLFPVENRSGTGPREEKRREEVKDKSATGDEDQGPNGFQSFWNTWPKNSRKVNRRDCLRRWIANDLEAIAGRIVPAVELAKKSRDWTKDDGAFVPQPATWLNQRRWEAFAAPAPKPIAAPVQTPWQWFDAQPATRQAVIESDIRSRLRSGTRVQQVAAGFNDAERRASAWWIDEMRRAMKEANS